MFVQVSVNVLCEQLMFDLFILIIVDEINQLDRMTRVSGKRKTKKRTTRVLRAVN